MERDANISINTSNTEQRMHKTENGLVVKGVSMIEAITTDYDLRVRHEFRSKRCSRLVRRDFNMVSAKILKFGRSTAELETIERKLLDINIEADAIHKMAQMYHLPLSTPSTSIDLRIVSRQSNKLYRAVVLVDESLARFSNSEMKSVAVEICKPFFRSFSELKFFVLPNHFNNFDAN